MYHANQFHLVRHEALPVYRYSTVVDPYPANSQQLYQILGSVAKKIMYEERIPVISDRKEIVSLSSRISTLKGHTAEIQEVGKFGVELRYNQGSTISIDHFDEYKTLVNRLADIALTVFSSEYYKFHPEAPFVVRDEPYFDSDLIEKTGIIDSKKYYRGLHKFNGHPVFALNRETELRSNKNLLREILGLKKRFELRTATKSPIDFYDPPKEFVDYVNSILSGKAADVQGYPGPRVREIKEVTWHYRAGDVTPGSEISHVDYLRSRYGLVGLDENQPLIVYEVGDERRIQYHVPEVLSVGHTLHDLEKLIPSWQRPQVWGLIHPNCKNQLQKIYAVMYEVDEALRRGLPNVYPKLVEISTNPLDVSSFVSQPTELTLKFKNKDLKISSPYNVGFYRKYTDKKILFAKPVGPIRALVYLKRKSRKLLTFLDDLAREFKLRNNTELSFVYSYGLDLEATDFSDYDLVISIGGTSEEEDTYRKFKKRIQNSLGVIHQHVTEEHADKSSVMALVMELTLKLGGDPWWLPEHEKIPCVIGVYSYLNPFSGKKGIFAIAHESNGAVLKQFEPVEPAAFPELEKRIVQMNCEKGRVLYLFSFDRYDIVNNFSETLKQNGDIEYCVTEIVNQDYFRFFETWAPRKAPRFGEAAKEIIRSPFEAYERAPQGAAVKSSDDTFFLLTGRTIEKDATKRGCPIPIKLTVKDREGSGWDPAKIVDFVLELCMMGRASGHMTRFPSPLYYLHSYAYYWNDFGVPENAQIRNRVFYL